MDSDRIEGNWKRFKGYLREQWGHLTDDEIDEHRGELEQLEGKIQARTGETKDEIRAKFREFERELDQ